MISKTVLGSDQFKYSQITLHAGSLQFIFTHSSRLPQIYDKPGRLGTQPRSLDLSPRPPIAGKKIDKSLLDSGA